MPVCIYFAGLTRKINKTNIESAYNLHKILTNLT
jgi:hypothetical protein